jgi:Ser/Thr protein kinase RdoA (MazF antagonist)
MGDISLIRSILSEYDDRFQLTEPPTATRYRGFSGADIFRLGLQGGEFCLRGWLPNALSEERILGLHRLLQFIEQQGVSQIAVPVESKRGRSLVSHQGRFWQLEPWMPGDANFHANPCREKLYSAMETLANWHHAAENFSPNKNEMNWFRCEQQSVSPAVQERLKKIVRWQNGHAEKIQRIMHAEPATEFRQLGTRIFLAFDRLAPQIMNELRSVLEQPFSLQPCLRDIWNDHVLFEGDSVTGLIDLSACRLENVATDLARLLGSMVEDDREAWTFAVNCYRQHREFSDAEWNLMRILDRSTVLLSGLFWLNRKYLQPTRILDERAVLDRLRGIVRRQEFLADSL